MGEVGGWTNHFELDGAAEAGRGCSLCHDVEFLFRLIFILQRKCYGEYVFERYGKKMEK
jgi:hypothetical protein